MTGALIHEFCELRPAGGFGLIMADPPWSFENFSAKGEAKNPKAHYDCMGLDAIKAMPVSALAAPDCVLWMWAINPMVPQALQVIESWGFEVKTFGAWVKRTARGKDAFGTGYLFRSSSEPILIATRGAPKVTRATRSTVASYDADGFDPDGVGGPDGSTLMRPGADWPDTVITIEAKIREHSRKPDEAFAAAEALLPDVRRIELFSRQARPGWSAWGNETAKFAMAAGRSSSTLDAKSVGVSP